MTGVIKVQFLFCFLCCTATAVYWILNGQHKYLAAMDHRALAIKRGDPPPSWTTTFTCTVIKKDTPLTMVQRIAGRQQAKSQFLRPISFLQTVDHLAMQIEVILLPRKTQFVHLFLAIHKYSVIVK